MPQPTAQRPSEDEIKTLVYRFYEKIRADQDLGPIFEAKISSWDTHLPHMCDFWSSIMLKTARFDGALMPKHRALAGLVEPEHFHRWLDLFEETTHALFPPELAQEFQDKAHNIGQSLQLGMFGMDRVPLSYIRKS